MRHAMIRATAVVLAGWLLGCSEPPKLTAADVAAANEATEQVLGSEAGAVDQSHYQVYRWMTAKEMVDRHLGYDPSMSESSRSAVEQAVDDDLDYKGFRRGGPADLMIAVSDTYVDRNRSAPGWAFEGPAIEVTEGVGESQMEAYDDMEVYRKPEEKFAIVFLDAHTGRLVYRAVGKDVIDGTQTPEKIEAAVYRALDDMPVPLPAPSAVPPAGG